MLPLSATNEHARLIQAVEEDRESKDRGIPHPLAQEREEPANFQPLHHRHVFDVAGRFRAALLRMYKPDVGGSKCRDSCDQKVLTIKKRTIPATQTRDKARMSPTI
jgi:hypothetical protein